MRLCFIWKVVYFFFEGEKEGSTKSLDNVQSLYQEAKNENAQLVGRVHACESQIESLKKGKEEVDLLCSRFFPHKFENDKC
jgi:cell division protein FtsB